MRCQKCGSDMVNVTTQDRPEDEIWICTKCPDGGRPLDVTRLNHYTANEIQPIEIMMKDFTPQEFEGFLKGNALKYLLRYQNKDGLQDIHKAQTYVNWLYEFKKTGKVTVFK